MIEIAQAYFVAGLVVTAIMLLWRAGRGHKITFMVVVWDLALWPLKAFWLLLLVLVSLGGKR